MDTHNAHQLPNQHNVPARRRTQDISVTADASDNSESSPNMSQGPNSPPHEDARTHPETEPNKDNELEALLPRAPQTPTVALPEEDDSEDFSYSRFASDPGCGLEDTLTMHDDPDAMLDYIDDIFPGLFSMS